jgi:predicted DNA-binding transcriptional regulator AlpA
MTLTEELITAAVTATDEKKMAALRILRGETVPPPKDIADPERFLTLKECGRRLGLSACSLWRWGVPGHELGGRRKFRMTEVEAYLQSKEFKRKAAGLRRVKTLSSRQLAVSSGQ